MTRTAIFISILMIGLSGCRSKCKHGRPYSAPLTKSVLMGGFITTRELDGTFTVQAILDGKEYILCEK